MENKLRRAFGAVRAEAPLKEVTLEYLEHRRAAARPARRRWLPAVACLLAVALGLGGCGVYFTPTSVISVDVNPSVELSVNRFHRVIGASGQNADGQALVDTLSLRFLDYRDALHAILEAEPVVQYLSAGEVLSVAVADGDPGRRADMLAALADCTAGTENAYCYPAQPQDVEEAHHLGLSCGRYRVFAQIQALEPAFTPQEAAGLTMGQLQDYLARLIAENPGVLTEDSLLSHHGEDEEAHHSGDATPTAQPQSTQPLPQTGHSHQHH